MYCKVFFLFFFKLNRLNNLKVVLILLSPFSHNFSLINTHLSLLRYLSSSSLSLSTMQSLQSPTLQASILSLYRRPEEGILGFWKSMHLDLRIVVHVPMAAKEGIRRALTRLGLWILSRTMPFFSPVVKPRCLYWRTAKVGVELEERRSAWV